MSNFQSSGKGFSLPFGSDRRKLVKVSHYHLKGGCSKCGVWPNLGEGCACLSDKRFTFSEHEKRTEPLISTSFHQKRADPNHEHYREDTWTSPLPIWLHPSLYCTLAPFRKQASLLFSLTHPSQGPDRRSSLLFCVLE